MAYKVKLTAPAEADAYAVFEYIRDASSLARAEKWLVELFKVVLSLDEMPRRCPLISEATELNRDLRQILYGKGTGTYRIIFDIEEVSEEEPRVRVLRIWHGSRDKLRLEDLEEG